MENDIITRAGARPRPQEASRRILVAEDDPSIRTVNARMLSDSGYTVDAVEDGAAAWENLHRNNYDLLITDNSMPKVTGVELVKMLRDARMTLPVIMATGAPPAEQFSAIPGLQPPATLLKPYSFGELLGMVQSLLRANAPI